MSDIFADDKDNTEEEVQNSDIFGEIKSSGSTEDININRETGACADIFGNKPAKKSTVDYEEKKLSNEVKKILNEDQSSAKAVSAADKFKAAAAKSTSFESKTESSTGSGRRTLTPKTSEERKIIPAKQEIEKENVSVKDAATKVAKDISQRQSDARRQRIQSREIGVPAPERRVNAEARTQNNAALRQQMRRQQASAAADAIADELAERVGRRQVNTAINQLREQASVDIPSRRTVQPEHDRVEPDRRMDTARRQVNVERPSKERSAAEHVNRERPIPERPLRKRSDLQFKVVGEMHSMQRGGAGLLRRFLVGSLNGIKCKSIERKFKNAKEFKCKPFKFKIYNGEAMITSYSGNARILEFPAYVVAKSGERIPVCYIHSDCLYNNFCNNYKTRNAIDNLTSVDSSFRLDGKNKIIEIKLPEGLLAIFDGTFDNCMDINSLTIPSTVQFIGNHAFKGSTITKLFFNGEPISNWTMDLFPGMKIYVREDYADMY